MQQRLYKATGKSRGCHNRDFAQNAGCSLAEPKKQVPELSITQNIFSNKTTPSIFLYLIFLYETTLKLFICNIIFDS